MTRDETEKKEEYVVVIGGVNIDINGFPNENLVAYDSNPGKVKISLGGVGRNISENLVKLGVKVKLISAIGDDFYGRMVQENANQIGLDLSHSIFIKDHPTSTYLAVLDKQGNMNVAISAMDIIENINTSFIDHKRPVIKNAKVCVIDTNIPKNVIEYILKTIKGPRYFLDTVSTQKALKIKDLVGFFHTIKPNKMEAEILSGMKIRNEKDLEDCSKYFLQKGVQRVFISLGEEGIYYNDGQTKNHIGVEKIKVVNTTGAGDSFLASLVYCFLKQFDIDYSARFAIAAATITLLHEDTINPDMSVDNVIKIMK